MLKPEHIEPTLDRMLVKLDPPEEKQGLIYIPDTARGRMLRTGVVVRSGPGRTDERGRWSPPAAHPGQRVLLASELGWEMPDDHRIITPEAVLAVVPSWVDDLPTEKETDN